MDADEILKSLKGKQKQIEAAKLNVARIQGALDVAEKDLNALGIAMSDVPATLALLDAEMLELNSKLEKAIEQLENFPSVS